jgi:hypothetical protein
MALIKTVMIMVVVTDYNQGIAPGTPAPPASPTPVADQS